jgi:hypothetical protein
LSSARHAVIHERARQGLAGVRIERDHFRERLADAHGEATVDLSLEQQRVDDDAGIVHRGGARERYLAGVGIDLDLADVAAVGEVRPRRREHAHRFQAEA